MQPFSQLATLVFNFLVAPQEVSRSIKSTLIVCECNPKPYLFALLPSSSPPPPLLLPPPHFPLQSSHFLSQLEEFSSHYSLGLSALKNLVKSVLIISSSNPLPSVSGTRLTLIIKTGLIPSLASPTLSVPRHWSLSVCCTESDRCCGTEWVLLARLPCSHALLSFFTTRSTEVWEQDQ